MYLLSCTHEAEWIPFQTQYFSEHLLAPGIEPGTSGYVARNSDHQTAEAVRYAAVSVDKAGYVSALLSVLILHDGQTYSCH
jgi:hypothetical protein